MMKKFKDSLKKDINTHKELLATFKSTSGYIVYDFGEHVMVKFDNQGTFKKLQKLISRVGNEHDYSWSEGENVLTHAYDFYENTNDEYFLSNFENCVRVIKNRKLIRSSNLEPLLGMDYYTSRDKHILDRAISDLLTDYGVWLTG